MAQGDYVTFTQAKEDLGLAIYDLASDTIKFAIIDSVVTPTASTSDPRWGAGGGTNLSTNEVTPGGNYTAGGDTVAATWTEAGGTITFDTANNTWAVDGANPTDARWIIVYDDTALGKQCIGFIDLGSVFDMTTGPLEVQVNSLFTLV